MRLLVITPHFAPDTAPTGDVVTAVVGALGRLGHEAHVVTSLPWYADHRIAEGWRGRPVRRGHHEAGTVTRLHPFPTDKASLVSRMLGFAGFSGLAAVAGIGARGRFDAVLALSPPLSLGVAGWLAARRHRCPLVLDIQDVFPDVAVEVGAITSPGLIGMSSRLERFCYGRADAVRVLSDDLAANVGAKVAGMAHAPRVEVIPNPVDTTFVTPLGRDTAYRRELGLSDRTVVMYAGNLGHSQSLDLLVEAARRHADRPDIAYVVNGGGVMADHLTAAAQDLPNLSVVGYQPADRVPEVLATADIHVVLLKAGLGSSSVPSKAFSALAAGRPLIASIDPGTEVARVVAGAGAGTAVPPDDPDAFVAAVERLADDPDGRRRMGEAGRAWIEQRRSPESVAAAFVVLLEELLSRR